MKRLSALLCLAVMACQSPHGTGPEPKAYEIVLPIVEVWSEKLPEGTLFFAGCRLDSLSLDRAFRTGVGEGRFTLVEKCWTDEIGCSKVDGVTKCSAGNWINRYRGTFRREDSSLVFTSRFESTTAPERAPPSGNDSVEAVFKLQHIDWNARLVLERVGGNFGQWGKPVLELIRPR